MSDMLALAKAIDGLTAALVANGAALGATPPPAENNKPGRKPKETPAPAAEPETPAADEPEDKGVEIKKLVLEIAKTDRAGVVALLSEFGAEKAGDVPVAKHVEFLGRLEALKAGGGDGDDLA